MLSPKTQYRIYPMTPSGYYPVHVSYRRAESLVHMKQDEIDNLTGDISYVEPIQ